MLLEAIYAGVLIANYVYHRCRDSGPTPPEKTRMEVPKVDEGVSVPMIFGRVRVRQPLVSWSGGASLATETWQIRMLWSVGIPFEDGTTTLVRVWFDDVQGTIDGTYAPSLISGTANTSKNYAPDVSADDYMQLTFYWGDGSSTQDFGSSAAGAGLLIGTGVDGDDIPGYRGRFVLAGTISRHQPNLPPITFEVSTYAAFPSRFSPPLYFVHTQRIGEEANPADVIAALLCDRYGKLARSNDIIDSASFQLVAQTLNAEQHGYSRSFEERMTTGEMIDEVIKQIDGGLYFEQTTGKYVLRLVRADYDPNALQTIDPTNCESIDNFAIGGWANTINKVRVIFTNRADGYRDGSGIAQNMANAAGQDGEVREQIINMPGICTQELADAVAARELAFSSRPLRKCRAKVNRTFWNRRPLDVVTLNWPELNISNAVMRVAAVSRGTASENCVYLDLIEDYFYVHRKVVHPGSGTVGSLPGVLLG